MKKAFCILFAALISLSCFVFSVSAEESAPLTAKRAIMISEDTIVIEFSEPVQLLSNSFNAVRLSENGLGVTMHTVNGKKSHLQFSSKFTVYEEDPSKVLWKFHDGSSDFGKNIFTSLGDIVDLTHPELSGMDLKARFCIEELTSTGKNITAGFIENIAAKSDKTKLLTANKPSHATHYDASYLTIEKDFNYDISAPGKEVTDEDLHAKRAVMINENTIVIEFSAPVEFSGDNPFSGIRLTDSTFGVRRGTIDGIEDYLQWAGSLKVYSKDPSKIIWTFNEKGDRWSKFKGMFPELEPIVDKSDERLVQFTKYTPYFCFEGMPNSGSAAATEGYIDNIRSIVGKNPLTANLPSSGKIYDGLYLKIEKDFDYELEVEAPAVPSTPEVPDTPAVPDKPTGDELVIKRAVMANENTIVLEFSEAVTLAGDMFVAIRLNTSGKGVSKATINGKEGYLQFDSDLKLSADGTKAIWTYNSSRNPWGKEVFPDLAGLIDGTNSAIKDLGLKVTFCVEEKTDTGKNKVYSLLESIRSKNDPSKMLTPTHKSTGSSYDAVYLTVEKKLDYEIPPVEVTYPTSVAPVDAVILRRAVQIDESRIVLEFSEAVTVKKAPYAAIRYCDGSVNGTNSKAVFGVKKGKIDGKNTNLQFEGKLEADPADPTRLIWTLNDSSLPSIDPLNITDIVERNGDVLSAFKEYTAYFCIEGVDIGTSSTPEPWRVDNIASTDGTRTLLANLKNGNNVNDAVYAAIEKDLDYDLTKKAELPKAPAENVPYNPNALNITEVRVKNGKQMLITFDSDAVIHAKPYAAIRYVNENGTLQKDGDTYLQWEGSLSVSGNTATWTYTGSKRTLAEVFAMKDYESYGYRLAFCIEGLTANANVPGLIDNITNPDGTKLLCASKKNAKGIYDGIYVYDIKDIDKATVSGNLPTHVKKGVALCSFDAVDDTTARLVFTEAVTAVGEGSLSTQYCPILASLRYVDANYAQCYDGNKKLEFKGTVSFDDTDTAIFELWNSVSLTIPEIFAMKGYENSGYSLIFVVEGTEDTELLPTPAVGYIDNVRSLDGSKLLIADVSDENGVTDALWFDDFKVSSLVEKDPEDSDNEPVQGDDSVLGDDKQNADDENSAEGNVTVEPEASAFPLWIPIVGVAVIIIAVVLSAALGKKKK